MAVHVVALDDFQGLVAEYGLWQRGAPIRVLTAG